MTGPVVTRWATCVSLVGLATMSGVVGLLSLTSAASVETRAALYLGGLGLFILGGSARDIALARHRRR